jgi:uncharacterized protein
LADIRQKEKRLFEMLAGYSGLAVALSGGVDSTYLLYAANRALKGRVAAATADCGLQPRREALRCREAARQMGVPHFLQKTRQLESAEFLGNPPGRCYICKTLMFEALLREARSRGFAHLVHGSNMDDAEDFRPGLKAARELRVEAPLARAGLSKAEIRELAAEAGLSVWNQPASGCLATRIPYGTEITRERLERVERAEDLLADMGFRGVRVRFHGDLAKIEVPEADIPHVLREKNRPRILEGLKSCGFHYVALDLEAFRSGRLNRPVEAGDGAIRQKYEGF